MKIIYSKKEELLLFCTGFLQVFLVAVNTYQLAHQKYLGSLIIGFLISFVWTFNVKKVAFGKFWERVIYSSGAAVGTVSGLLLSIYFYENLLK